MKNRKVGLLNIFTPVLFALPFSANSAEIVVEAGGADTTSTGTWRSASGASLPYNGNKGFYAITQGEDETYTFAPNLPENNLYEVQVYNTCYSPRSNQVTHYIHHSQGTDTHILEQDCGNDPFVGEWRALGAYQFAAGNQGSVVIDTRNSNNSYVGATAVRFVYTPNETTNSLPSLTLSESAYTVQEGSSVTINAVATDMEDGDLSDSIVWTHGEVIRYGNQLNVSNIQASQEILVTVTDSDGVSVSSTVTITVENAQASARDNYDFCGSLEPLNGFVTNNASALPDTGIQCGRYVAKLYDNTNEVTLHYHERQGRFDGVPVSFPFEVVARNVGTAPIDEPNKPHNTPGSAFTFAGLQVHHIDLDNTNSAHMVVGQRGDVQNTIEGKTTIDGDSYPDAIGSVLPEGRADLRIVGNVDGSILAYWQLPNLSGNTSNDNWMPYDGTGVLPGQTPNWGTGNVYVGLITYAYQNRGIPFMGVVDSLEVDDNPL